MDLLDRLLGHDSWTTRQLLDLAGTLSDNQLDQEFDIGHRTVRRTFAHIIWNAPSNAIVVYDETTGCRGHSRRRCTDLGVVVASMNMGCSV